MEKNYLTVGYIVRTRGLKGVLKVKSSTHFASTRYKKGNKLYLFNPKDQTRFPVYCETYSNEGEFDFVSFKDYQDINLVEKWIGFQIQVCKDEIPALEEGTYYYSELEGLECVDEENNTFGKVLVVEDFTSQPSLRVQLKNQKTILIPYVQHFIKKVDLENHRIIIHLIPGMIEE